MGWHAGKNVTSFLIMFRTRRARPDIEFIRILDNDGSSMMYQIKERGDVTLLGESTSIRGPVMPIFEPEASNKPTVEKKTKGMKCIGLFSDEGIRKLEASQSESRIPNVFEMANLLNPVHSDHHSKPPRPQFRLLEPPLAMLPDISSWMRAIPVYSM